MSGLAAGLVSVSVTTLGGSYKDLADFNLVVDTWPDVLSGPLREYAQADRPGRIGSVLLSTDATYKPAQFQITGTVYARTSSYSYAAMLTDLRNLKGWVARCAAVKVSGIDSTMVRSCKLTGFTSQDIGIVGSSPAMRVSMTFEGVDPLWYAASATSNDLTTSLTEQALGTAPVWPVITFTGAPSGLTLTYADSAGATVQTLTLAGITTSGATQTVVDCNLSRVVTTISSVETDMISTLDTATDFFALDPKDGDYSNTASPSHPQLKYALSGGSVSGVTCAYQKAYY